MNQEMNVLITGDTGFIGKNMKNFLTNQNVHVIPYSTSNNHDIFNYEQLKKEVSKADLVYHFAAYAKPGQSILEPRKAIETNVNGCLSILEACRHTDVPLIYPSSCEIYGNTSKSLTEDSPINPTNPYAASKASADAICQSYFVSYGMDIKVIRFFNPYGPYQQLNKIMPTMYSQAIQNKDITVYGKGEDTRDYVYISDIVRGMWMARELPKGEIINLATGRETTNYEIASLIISLTQSDSNIVYVDYPKEFGNIKNQVGSYSKAQKMMGWCPEIKLEEGIKKTINWLESFKC